MLAEITPMILTLNEEDNIGRTLAKLSWAKRILLIDSGSTDHTLDIAAEHSQAVVLRRKFDSAAAQCNFGLQRVESEWVLSMDADYVLSDDLVAEIAALQPRQDVHGYSARFIYKVLGRPLRRSLYPSRVVLYRRDRAHYHDEGHTQRVVLDGGVGKLNAPIFHDDRKPLGRWLVSQTRYASLEANYLLSGNKTQVDLMDRLRLLLLPAPILMFFYTFFLNGYLFAGRPGWIYAWQRIYAEVLLAIQLLDRRLRSADGRQ